MIFTTCIFEFSVNFFKNEVDEHYNFAYNEDIETQGLIV